MAQVDRDEIIEHFDGTVGTMGTVGNKRANLFCARLLMCRSASNPRNTNVVY